VVYSQFRGLVDQGKVASARFDDSSQRVYFELRPEYLRQVKTAAGDLAWPEGARQLNLNISIDLDSSSTPNLI